MTSPSRGGGGRGRVPVLLVGCAVLLGGGWGFRSETSVPAPVSAEAPRMEFSAERAMGHLEEIAQAPRPVGSPEHARVRNYLLAALEEMGVEGEVQTARHLDVTGSVVRATTLRNVVARLPGSGSDGAIVLTTHYDGVPLSPAAGDAGMALAAILEIVRALQEGPALANDVIVLFTDGEERGLLGAQAFMSQHPWRDEVRLVLALEQHLRPGELLEDDPFARPPGLMPSAPARSDRVLIRTPVTLRLSPDSL